MKVKLFRKNLKPSCGYCVYSHSLSNPDVVLCLKKGVVNSSSSCRRFSYDPLKRKPKVLPPFKKYSKDTFSLE